MRARPTRPTGAGTLDDAVTDALRAVPRRDFLPATVRGRADDDVALPLGHGQTGSQPSTVAAMLRLLDVRPGQHVLDVGSGSGWTTALLAHLVGPGGEVLGLELEPSLVAFGRSNLDARHAPWARVEAADPRHLGRARPGGWDRILASASPDELPRALVHQLAPGGRLVVPVRTTMVLVQVDAAGRAHASEHGSYVFVPLRGPLD
ncbi:protein-L-isoaspartate O-methyltransferase [Luteimicrobium sp. NPDC057192]|uniref:protein-L-isoaspartate O-methyltransferase family protein n=1 Tax=Luteimicrobium sp. NPDC057192 TaxID=3346042 RepID=UPI00364269D1